MKFIFIFILVWVFPFVSSAHYVLGYVENAKDGFFADDKLVVVWNSENGLSDNLTDIVGVNGNSGVSNFFMIDCEMLDSPCEVEENLSVKIFNSGDYYFSEIENLTITGAGYDIFPNLSLQSPPKVSSIFVDDLIFSPENEIDLIATSTREVFCEAVVEEFDLDDLVGAVGEFYDSDISFSGDIEDNNYHYTNSSCFINESYGAVQEKEVICKFDIFYYTNPSNWECLINVEDNQSSFGNKTDNTLVNTLLSIEVVSMVDFGSTGAGSVTEESVVNVTNYGNVDINLSLSGYGGSLDDGHGMVCGIKNISIDFVKYNLTSSTFGNLNLGEFENFYINLTSSPVVREFNLFSRQNDLLNEAVLPSYWRVYVPSEISEVCSGNIVFGATQEGGI